MKNAPPDAVEEQKCPSCGAAMRFDPKEGRLVCDSCGRTEKISASGEAQEAQLGGFDFENLAQQAVDPDAEALPIYHCVSCGAEVIADAQRFSLTCPYCGNNIVLTDKVSGKLRPDGVLPFQITSDTLPDAMTRFYKGKRLLPKNFFSDSRMGSVTGVYLPFWVFDGNLSGVLDYAAERSSTHRSGDYIITDTSHYILKRDVSVDFKDVPVDASGRIDDALMDSLEPFDMQQEQPFDTRFLAGFAADRFDQAKEDTAERARARMRSTAESIAHSQAGAGYGLVRQTGGSLTANLKARYVLFPVYLFDLMHNGNSYHFAVNGQSGKVVGNLPIDRGVSFRYFLLRMGVILLALLGVSVVRYFMGR